MKKQNLLVLLASLGMLTACGGGNGGGTTPPGPETIPHDQPFVTTITDPSETRQYREEFDLMVEDFSGETPSGTTTGEFKKSFLRVLVDSEDPNEPKTPDASIYKIGKDGLDGIDGIGFRIRAVGNKKIKNSNLVLGLRGGDEYAVYQLKLSDALDPDGEDIPELTDQFQDIIISRNNSLDSSEFYKNPDGSDSELGLLDKLVGIHFFALDEECSAVIEIEEVFVTDGAGNKTVLDNFNREKANGKEDGIWWRDSTGYIQQRGVTLKEGNTYTTGALEVGEYQNFVIAVQGNTTGLTVNGVDYSALKDSTGASLTGAVNGAFYNYVVNLEASNIELTNNTLTFVASNEVTISRIFLTNLQNEVPMTEYPHLDIDNAVYFDKFNNRTMAAGTLDGDYDKSAADQAVQDAGFNFILSYHGSDKISIEEGKLVFAATEENDYAQYKAGSKVSFAGMKYMIISAKGDISGLRIALKDGGAIIYSNQWLAGAGLPTLPVDAEHYVYNQDDGYRLYVVDLAKTGYENNVSDIVDIYYTGTGLSIDAILFADEFKPAAKVQETLIRDLTVTQSTPDYTYVTGIDIPSGMKYLHIETTATVADQIRYEGADGAKWLNKGEIIDKDGNVVTDGATDYVIDLEASGLTGSAVHIHSTCQEAGFTMKVYFYEVIPAVEVHESVLFNGTVEAGTEYAYVTGLTIPEGTQYLHIETDATVANQIRYEGADGAKWLNKGEIIDKDGNVVTDGATDYVIDLEASGLTGNTIHVHSTKGEAAFSFKASAYSEELLPTYLPTELTNKAVADISGYAYCGGFLNHAGVQLIKVTLSSTTENQNLNSIRFEGVDGAKWINKGEIKDAQGNAISGETVITEEGITLVIDVVASGLKLAVGDAQFIHVHAGDVPGSTGNFTYTVEEVTEGGSYLSTLVNYAG